MVWVMSDFLRVTSHKLKGFASGLSRVWCSSSYVAQFGAIVGAIVLLLMILASFVAVFFYCCKQPEKTFNGDMLDVEYVSQRHHRSRHHDMERGVLVHHPARVHDHGQHTDQVKVAHAKFSSAGLEADFKREFEVARDNLLSVMRLSQDFFAIRGVIGRLGVAEQSVHQMSGIDGSRAKFLLEHCTVPVAGVKVILDKKLCGDRTRYLVPKDRLITSFNNVAKLSKKIEELRKDFLDEDGEFSSLCADLSSDVDCVLYDNGKSKGVDDFSEARVLFK